MESNNAIDVLLEKASNIEEIIHKEKVRKFISDCLRTLAKRERNLRESTIMVKYDDNLSAKDIPDIVEKKWSEGEKKPSITSWQDKEFVFLQFADLETKQSFLDFSALHMSDKFVNSIQPPTEMNEHMRRKPVKVIINNVRAAYKTELIKQGLEKTLPQGALTEFKEHKPNPITKARNIMFQTNEEGFKFLFGTLDGVMPYFGLTLNQKSRLTLKIFCKPWACRDCFSFGFHQCEGKLCAQCSGTKHVTKDCVQKTKYCRNCKKRGHRSKDPHCSVYLQEVAKELRKYAIPMEFLEESDLRFNLTKHLQYT